MKNSIPTTVQQQMSHLSTSVQNTYSGSVKSKDAQTIRQEEVLKGGQSDSGWFGGIFGRKKGTSLEDSPSPPQVIRAQGQLNEREVLETEVIKLLLNSYFAIVKRTLSDMVPKAIMFHLVQYSKDNMQSELLKEIYKQQNDLLDESAEVVQRRKELTEMLEALRRAEKIVNGI